MRRTGFDFSAKTKCGGVAAAFCSTQSVQDDKNTRTIWSLGVTSAVPTYAFASSGVEEKHSRLHRVSQPGCKDSELLKPQAASRCGCSCHLKLRAQLPSKSPNESQPG
jgi:hypothetical protein